MSGIYKRAASAETSIKAGSVQLLYEDPFLDKVGVLWEDDITQQNGGN